jgi:hypothetical protein
VAATDGLLSFTSFRLGVELLFLLVNTLIYKYKDEILSLYMKGFKISDSQLSL